MEKRSKIYIAGIHGMVGSAIARALRARGFSEIIGHRSSEIDLTRQADVENFFDTAKPEFVFLAAAKVGGIYANNAFPAEFIYQNLQIQNNIIHSAFKINAKKVLFLGSSCVYPKFAQQPIKEEYLLTGALETTNEAYAIAKIAGLKMCEYYNKQYGTNYISVMPTNLYGPGDHYDTLNSHVLPALIRRFHEAKTLKAERVTIWGTGTPMREFLHVDDLADACLFLMDKYTALAPINVGSGEEISIIQLAELIKKIVGFQGAITLDTSKPDGTPRKLTDSSRIHELGWRSKTPLAEGIQKTYAAAMESLDMWIKSGK